MSISYKILQLVQIVTWRSSFIYAIHFRFTWKRKMWCATNVAWPFTTTQIWRNTLKAHTQPTRLVELCQIYLYVNHKFRKNMVYTFFGDNSTFLCQSVCPSTIRHISTFAKHCSHSSQYFFFFLFFFLYVYWVYLKNQFKVYLY